MNSQGFEVKDNILYQDNKSAKGDVRVVWCPTDGVIANYLTKPLHRKAFVNFRNLLMGAV